MPKLSPKRLCHFILPPAMFESANFSTSLSMLGSVISSINLLITNKHFILKVEREMGREKEEKKKGVVGEGRKELRRGKEKESTVSKK